MHKHHWLCSDVPGVYTCGFDCGFGYWNPDTNSIENDPVTNITRNRLDSTVPLPL